MKAITANLKIFYQRPGLYFWYFIIACQLPVLLMTWFCPEKMEDNPGTMSYLLMSLLLGMAVGSLQKDLVCRPITFCLPGHHKVNHKLIFSIGVPLTVIPVAMMTKGILLSSDSFLLTVTALWAVGLACYLLTVCLSYRAEFSSGRPSLAGGVWCVLSFSIFLGGYQKVWHLALETPFVLIIPSLALTIYFWFYFRKESLRRNLCGQETMSMFGGWNMRKTNDMQIAWFTKKTKDRSRVSLWLERFFVEKIKNDPQAKNRASAGAIYTALDRGATMSHIRTGPILMMLLMCGYLFGTVQTTVRGEMELSTFMLDIFYIMPIFGAMMHLFPSHPTLHIPARRKDKLYASLTMAISVVIVTTVFMGLVVGFVNIIAPYMPNIPLTMIHEEMVMRFFAPKLSHVYIVPMLMPLGFLASVLFGNNKSGMLLAGPVVYMGSMVYVFSQAAFNTQFVVPVIFVVGWALFIAALRWHCLERNLV